MQTIRYASIICGLLFCSFLNIDALVFTVTNTADAGAGSLRMAITDLNAGGDPANNTIVFDLPGPGVTIDLDSLLPSITRQVVIDGLEINSGDRVTINRMDSDLVAVSAGLHFSTSAASNSAVTNLIIQNFTNTQDDGSAYGILFDIDVNNCSVINCQVSNITSADKPSSGQTDSEAMGIRSFESMNSITNNEINSISSSNDLVDNTGNVAGIYVEKTIFDNCSDNLINALSSGNAGGRSGLVFGIFANMINGNCQGNIIASLTSGSGDNSGDVIGIEIAEDSKQQCSQNIIALLTSGNASSLSGIARGISIITAKKVDDNIITQLTSGNSNTDDSGNVAGIFLFEAETANRNSASEIISGNAPAGTSGLAVGIAMGLLTSECNSNLINIVTTGTASVREGALGIFIIKTSTGVSISDSDISNITGVGGISLTGAPTVGIYLVESNMPLLESNTINTAVGVNGSAYGAILGCIAACGTGTPQAVVNGNLFNNTISNIVGSTSNGFGINISEQSKGNDILYTSIFNINGKAINIVNNGALVDAVITLEKIECCQKNNTFAVAGTIEPAVNLQTKQFLVQVFVSNLDMPPQVQTLIGEFTVQAFGSTEFCEIVNAGSVVLEEGDFITATATAIANINNNTSEVSNVILVPECITPNICGLIECHGPLPDPMTLCGFLATNRKTN